VLLSPNLNAKAKLPRFRTAEIADATCVRRTLGDVFPRPEHWCRNQSEGYTNPRCNKSNDNYLDRSRDAHSASSIVVAAVHAHRN
jgi:hypothetical protein